MPLEVAIPYHLADDYEELSKQYSRMKLSWAASSELFNTLTSSEKALILPLQKHVFRTVRNAVRQAGVLVVLFPILSNCTIRTSSQMS